jgi:hypothetical protein
MTDKTLKARTVTPFGIKYLDDHWWHESLRTTIGDTVYVTLKDSLKVFPEDPTLLVFDNEPSRLCKATRLTNPHRLLQDMQDPEAPSFQESEDEMQPPPDKGEPTDTNEPADQTRQQRTVTDDGQPTPQLFVGGKKIFTRVEEIRSVGFTEHGAVVVLLQDGTALESNHEKDVNAFHRFVGGLDPFAQSSM